MFEMLISPLTDHPFMRRALVACICLSIVNAPMGVFLTLRRLSLLADSLSHALLPGVAIGFLIAGYSMPHLSIGAFFVGSIVAIGAGWISRITFLREDSSFAALYLISMALGVLLISIKGGPSELSHILFGNILSITEVDLYFSAAVTTLVTGLIILFSRVFVLECFDSSLLHQMGLSRNWIFSAFLVLVVLAMVVSLQSMGTLLSVGLMMIPAATGRLLSNRFLNIVVLSIGVSILCSVTGLLLSFHLGFPSGPTVVLLAGLLYLVTLAIQKQKNSHVHNGGRL